MLKGYWKALFPQVLIKYYWNKSINNKFEKVFASCIYFNSAYIIPVGIILSDSFLKDVNLDILKYIVV